MSLVSPSASTCSSFPPSPSPSPAAAPVLLCLHTAHSNVAVLEAAARALGWGPGRLRHGVYPQWLEQVTAQGGLSPTLAAEIRHAAQADSAGLGGVLLTCSSLGPALADGGTGDGVLADGRPVLRIDQALACEAARLPGPQVVLYAAPSTAQVTQALFAAHMPAHTDWALQEVPGAWNAFLAGDLAAYGRHVQQAVAQAWNGGAQQVVLAQASMAAVGPVPGPRPPLTSPGAGLRAMAQRLGWAPQQD